MEEKSRLKNLIYAAAVIFIILFSSLFGGAQIAFAEETVTEYTDVLEDLQADEDFSEDDYPEGLSDFSLNVIQIAESSDNELFVYVYQPYTGRLYTDAAYDLTATSINISTGSDDNLNYINYGLTLINNSDTLYKYKVNGLKVSNSSERYYNISSIYRAYIEELDGATENDNTVSETALSVAQAWQVVTDEDGNVYYNVTETEVVVVTDKHVGFIRYWSGFSSSWVVISNTETYLDSHYIAFSTNYDIDYLYEADIYFLTKDYEVVEGNGLGWSSTDTNEGEETKKYLSLTYSDSVEYYTDYFGFFKRYRYTWDRIQTAEEFVNDDYVTLDSDVEEKITNMQYVLRFYETSFSVNYTEHDNGSSYKTTTSTAVSDVTILRLKFLCGLKVYNLGVVDNKQTGSSAPDGYGTGELLKWYDNLWSGIKNFFSNWDFSTVWGIIVSIIKIVIILALAGLFIWLMSIIWPFIKLIFKAIAAPFKGISNAIKKRQEKNAAKASAKARGYDDS